MKIERIDDKTVKCFLSNEELAEYELSYKDFLFRSEKAKEIVEEIIMQAKEEVGYEPPQYAFDLSVMMMPDQGMILTFSEKEPNLSELLSDSNIGAFMDTLTKAADAKIAADKKKKAAEENGQQSEETAAEASDSAGKAKREAKQEPGQPAKNPTFAVFAFRSIRDICTYAGTLPANIRIKSVLYEMNGTYYLYLDKGTASYERYSRACVNAMEFGTLYTAEYNRVEYLKEHAECLIAEHAVKKLRLNDTRKDK